MKTSAAESVMRVATACYCYQWYDSPAATSLDFVTVC